MGQYSWLAEKKEQEMAKKLQRRGMPSYQQLPIKERYGVSYTGRGPDGKLQPEAPAGMEGRHLFHEGEMKADTPEGSMYLDAKTTGMAYPETEQQQAEMKMYEKSGQLPGFMSGGWSGAIQSAKDIIAKAKKTVVPKVANQITVDTPEIQTIKPAGSQIEQPKVANVIEQPQVAKTVTTDTPEPVITPIRPAGTQGDTVAKTVTTDTPEPVITDIPKLTQEQQEELDRQKENAETEKANKYKEQMYREAADQEAERKATEEANRAKEEAYKKNRDEQTVVAGTEAEKTTTGKTTEDLARDQGMQWFMDALNKENPALMVEGRRALSELSSRQQQERSAMEQQLLQQGVDPGRARVEAQMLRNNQEGELNDLAAQFGIAGMQSRQEIAGTLASQGLAGQQFENDKKKYGDSEAWKSYEAAITAGDYDTAAKAYKTITGTDISMDQMKTYQTYLNTKNQQDIATGDITINRLKNDLGNDVAASVQDRINSGRNLEQINAEFPNAKLTMAEFQSMYDATPTGQRSFERNLGFANTLLQAEDGKGTNTAAAVKILNELFPGTGIDFSGVVTTAKAATFNKGMGMLSDYVAANMDWEEAEIAMEKDGTLEMLGLDKPATEKLYRSLKVNAIDEQLKAITDSTLLTDEEKADAKTFATAVLTGQLDYKIQKEYTVTDKDGKVTTMYMDSSAAASYATSNPGSSIVGTGKSKIVPITDILDDDEEDTDATPTKRTEDIGTVIVENGKIYQVIADGKTQEITPDVDDPFSDNNKKIIDAGEKDNPYYKTIFDKQYSELTGGNDIAGKLNTSAVAGTNYNLDQFNKTFDEYKDLSFENPVIQKLKKDLETASTRSSTTKITIVKDGNSWKITRA
jgi:hypothetical protein